MTHNLSRNAISTQIAAISLLVAGASASAHTTIQSQATEATTTYNNLVIGHGCTLADGTKLPVIAQSVVFPTIDPVVTVSDGKWAGSNEVLTISSLAGIPRFIQSKDVFNKQSVKTDSKGNVIGFSSTEGSLDTGMIGLVPFRTGGIAFKAESCIKRLLIKVAIADICEKNKTYNLWIPNATPKFSNPLAHGLGAPATLTINRDLTKNPFKAESNCGNGYDITITPSNRDIDANLPIPGYL